MYHELITANGEKPEEGTREHVLDQRDIEGNALTPPAEGGADTRLDMRPRRLERGGRLL